MARSVRRRILVLLGTLVCLAVLFLVEEHVRGRVALAMYKHELTSRGERLTPESLGLLPDKNWESKEAKAMAQAMKEISDLELSMPFVKAVNETKEPGRQYALLEQGKLSDYSKEITWEEFSHRLDAARPTLMKLREALRQPTLSLKRDNEWITNRKVPVKHYSAINERQSAQWLNFLTLDAVRRGNMEEAVENIEMMAAMSRFQGNRDSLVACMIGVALEGLGVGTTWEVLQANGWNDAQLARLQKAWETNDPLNDVVQAIEAERVRQESLMDRFGPTVKEKVRVGDGEPRKPLGYGNMALVMLWRVAWADQEKLEDFKSYQFSIEHARLIANHQWLRSRDMMKADSRTHGAWDQIRCVYTRLAPYGLVDGPDWLRAKERILGTEMQRVEAIAAIALKRCQLKNGKYPETLDALVPDFLSKVPLDPVDGKPLRYHLKADGMFTLYSVGRNGTDEGGDPGPAPTEGSGAFNDWRAWALDITWPEPLHAEPPRLQDTKSR